VGKWYKALERKAKKEDADYLKALEKEAAEGEEAACVNAKKEEADRPRAFKKLGAAPLRA
jgi:hypothetical protein